MKAFLKFSFTFVGSVLLGAVSASAGIVTIDFGQGTHVFSTWPGFATGSSSTGSIALPAPLLVDAGELQLTAIGGALVCAQSTSNLALCGSDGAYGLGVKGGAQDPRIDLGESITLTLTNPAYISKLVSFTVTGFSSPEQGQYRINAGAQNIFAAPTLNIVPGTAAAFTSVTWSVPVGTTGNYTLSSVTLDISTPEPATISLVGLALAGIGLACRNRMQA